MKESSLPSPGKLSMGHNLRREVAQAISAAQISSKYVTSGKSRTAAQLSTFLTACAAATAVYATGAPTGFTTDAIVANRTKFPTAAFSIASGACSQKTHWAPTAGAIDQLRTHTSFWYLGVSFTLQLPAGTYTMGQFIEYPQGTFTPVTWAGASTIALSTTVRLASSDVVPGVTIPAGAQYWIHTYNAGGAAANIACAVHVATAAVLGVNDVKYAMTAFAPAHQTGGEAATSTFGPFLVTGRIAADNARSVYVMGDSITYGTGDITTVGAKGATGYLQRALDTQGLGYGFMGVGGMSAFDLRALIDANNVTIDAWTTVIKTYATDIVWAYGVNDLRLARTRAQLYADNQVLYTEFPAQAAHQITITPRSDTTDSYATTANQTARVDGTYAGLTTANTEIRAVQTNVDRVIDSAAAAMSALNSNIWTAPPAATTDGTHPTSVKSASMATAISPIIV